MDMITEKFIKSYQKEYEKEVAAGNRGIYRDAEEYYAECLEIYEECCKGHPAEKQIRTWLLFLRSPELLGCKMAFSSGDMELLHNALYQTAVIAHAKLGSASGFDHCHNVWPALHCIAAGLTERVPLLLPEKFGMSRNGPHVSLAVANLLMALWYKRADFETEGRISAEKALGTKMTGVDYAAIRYLIALLDGDAAAAGEQLDLYCRGVARVKGFGLTKLTKMFWPQAHGLYNTAFAVWERQKALEIPRPEQDCFCSELADWQTARDFRPGKLFLRYPEPFDLVGCILGCTPPEFTLFQPYLDTDRRYKNQYYLNEELFREQFIAKVLEDNQLH